MGRKPKAENANVKEAPMLAELSSPPLPIERHNLKTELSKSPKALSMVKRLPKDKCFVRRSNRLRSIVRPVQSRDIQVVEEINLISEGEDEPHIEEPIHEPMPEEKSLEEKVDYLLQVVEELRSKVLERHFTNESTSDDLSYKSLYFESLKKIEASNSEVYQCNKKLEFALGKLEAYEGVKGVMDKLKEVILISNLGKATETVVNLSSQLTSSRGTYTEQDTGAPPQDMTMISPTKKKKRGNKD